MRFFAAFSVLFFGLFVSTGSAQIESLQKPGETVIEAPDPLVADDILPGRPESSAKALKVVDHATGQSIPGARVTVIEENDHPEPPRWPVVVATTTNYAGFAWLDIAPLLARPVAIVVEADGYGPVTAGAYSGTEIVRLAKSVDLPVRVVDGDGAPIPNASIGYHFNCGHMPNLREAVTDANGLAVLRSINPDAGDLWIAASGFRIDDYFSVSEWDGTEHPLVVTLRRGSDALGRIVDSGGRPIADLLVGTRGFHRGPWTRTDADGRFRLIGTDERTEIEIVRTIDKKQLTYTASRSPNGVTRMITLPEEPGDCEAGPRVKVDVAVGDRGGRSGCAYVTIRFLRESDGVTAHAVTDGEGAAEIDLLPGEYRIDIDADDRSTTPLSSRVKIDADSPRSLTFEIERSSETALPIARPSAMSRVFYSVGEIDMPLEIGDGATYLPTPIGTDGTLRIETKGKDPRYFPAPFKIDPLAGRIDEWPPSVVQARFVDENGAPVVAHSAVVRQSEFGDAEQPWSAARGSNARHLVDWGGPAVLVVSPLDPNLQPTGIPVLLPRREGQTIDLQKIVIRTRADSALVVAPSNDAGAEGRVVKVDVRRGRLTINGSTDEMGRVDLPWPIEDGDQLTIETEESAMPYRTTVRKSATGPTSIDLPRGSLEVEIVDAQGSPVAVEGVLLVDDREFDIVGGKALVTGIGEGRHDVAIGVRGKRSSFWELTFEKDERRTLKIRSSP